MRFLFIAVSHSGIAEFGLRQSPTWFWLFHKLIVGTERECQLFALAGLGQLCLAEQAVGGKTESSYYCSVQARKEQSFRRFLPTFREAVQVKM